LDPIIGITILLAAALVGGVIALRLKQPVILGYLIVGVITGPHALGLFKNLTVIQSAAAIGVALLMFTLGLEFSFGQLKQVGKIGFWGSLLQIFLSALLGVVVGITLLKWSLPQSILFGLVIYNSSTALCLKLFMDRGELDSLHGRIAVAILVFQDIAAVILILVLPFMSQAGGDLIPDVFIAIGKIVAFIIVALVFGVWVLPWLLGRIGGVGPHELFLLTVLVLAMGAAVGTYQFGMPSVFGAFIIGFVLRQLRFSNQAMVEIGPFRDVFVAIFFVSLGMLLDVGYVVDQWRSILMLVPTIIFIKLMVVFGVTWYFGYGRRVALLSGVALYQIGEFGFIIAQSGLSMNIISDQNYSLIIASAIITMMLTPSTMSIASWAYEKFTSRRSTESRIQPVQANHGSSFSNPVIIAGYGRIGQNVAQGLVHARIPFTVIELDPEHIPTLKGLGLPYIYGDSSNPAILAQAGLDGAKIMVITYPDQMAVANTVINALSRNPKLEIIARAHRPRDMQLLEELGVNELISPEHEASIEFLKRTLTLSGLTRHYVAETINSTFKPNTYV
jgi:monovalent cation:H+ antiporter-2, CPA2 family